MILSSREDKNCIEVWSEQELNHIKHWTCVWALNEVLAVESDERIPKNHDSIHWDFVLFLSSGKIDKLPIYKWKRARGQIDLCLISRRVATWFAKIVSEALGALNKLSNAQMAEKGKFVLKLSRRRYMKYNTCYNLLWVFYSHRINGANSTHDSLWVPHTSLFLPTEQWALVLSLLSISLLRRSGIYIKLRTNEK